jgi:methylmalonyl-CoA/ethylmalonyl-CoA epimerase
MHNFNQFYYIKLTNYTEIGYRRKLYMKSIIQGVRQIGFVVENLDETLKYYSEELGITEWLRFEINKNNLKDCPHFTHGKELSIEFKGAKGMVGNIEFEFMQPVSDNTIYAEFLRNHKPGVHHLSLIVSDYEEGFQFFESKEYEVIQTAISPFGNRIAYFDSYDQLGYDIEIVSKISK